MTQLGSELAESALSDSIVEKRQSTNLNSRGTRIQRLRRGPSARAKFVESHLSKGLAFQIRSLREKEDWSQQELASKIGSNQNAVYRAENPNYGKQTLSTLRKIAAAFDVGLAVRFVPFSELVDWTTATPHLVRGLNSAALAPDNFAAEERAYIFDQAIQTDAAKAQPAQLTSADFASGAAALASALTTTPASGATRVPPQMEVANPTGVYTQINPGEQATDRKLISFSKGRTRKGPRFHRGLRIPRGRHAGSAVR